MPEPDDGSSLFALEVPNARTVLGLACNYLGTVNDESHTRANEVSLQTAEGLIKWARMQSVSHRPRSWSVSWSSSSVPRKAAEFGTTPKIKDLICNKLMHFLSQVLIACNDFYKLRKTVFCIWNQVLFYLRARIKAGWVLILVLATRQNQHFFPGNPLRSSCRGHEPGQERKFIVRNQHLWPAWSSRYFSWKSSEITDNRGSSLHGQAMGSIGSLTSRQSVTWL